MKPLRCGGGSGTEEHGSVGVDGDTLSALDRPAVVPTTRDVESYGDGSSSPVQEKLAAGKPGQNRHAAYPPRDARGDVDGDGVTMEMDRWEPVPVPHGDGRHDIGDDVRAAIVKRLTSDWSHDPALTPEKVRQLAMWAGASVRALLHELGTLRDMAAALAGDRCYIPERDGRRCIERPQGDHELVCLTCMMDWHPIEALPSDAVGRLLVIANGVRTIATITHVNGERRFWSEAAHDDVMPTHWMPLPDLPREETQHAINGKADG